MKSLDLSICIPVYNCAEFLGAALDSILPQLPAHVEVVVYDGGSTDGTPALVESYAKRCPNLQYHRGRERGGIDADLATCARFAQGRYMWFFSGDDVMRPGAILRALAWCAKGADVYLCKHAMCTKTLEPIQDYPVLSPDTVRWAEFSDAASRSSWFQHSVTSEAFFSFLSGLVVRREKWESGNLPREFDRSCWGHVARLFDLVGGGLQVCYVAEVWLDKRGGNDSFADRGVVNRFRIAIDGYHRMAVRYFGRYSLEAFHIRKVIRKEFGLRSFLMAKSQCSRNPGRENRNELDRLFRIAHSDGSLREDFTRLAYACPDWIIGSVRAMFGLFHGALIEGWLRRSSPRTPAGT